MQKNTHKLPLQPPVESSSKNNAIQTLKVTLLTIQNFLLYISNSYHYVELFVLINLCPKFYVVLWTIFITGIRNYGVCQLYLLWELNTAWIKPEHLI